MVRPLVAAGALDLGENYPQELWRKAEALADLEPPVRWHLIGHLQANKAKRTLPAGEDDPRGRFAQAACRRSTRWRPELADPPSVCLQVNTSGEEAKHGWSAEADPRRRRGDRRLPGDPGRRPDDDGGAGAPTPRRPGRRSSGSGEVRDELRRRTGLPLPELSMGMSGDFESAIEEGATLVRVGSALFEGVET